MIRSERDRVLGTRGLDLHGYQEHLPTSTPSTPPLSSESTTATQDLTLLEQTGLESSRPLTPNMTSQAQTLFACAECPARFDRKSNLKRHIQSSFISGDAAHSARRISTKRRQESSASLSAQEDMMMMEDSQLYLDPRAFYKQLREDNNADEDIVTRDDVTHYAGQNIPPICREHSADNRRGLRDRVHIVRDPDPDPQFTAFHNLSMGSPPRKTLRFSAFNVPRGKQPLLKPRPWHMASQTGSSDGAADAEESDGAGESSAVEEEASPRVDQAGPDASFNNHDSDSGTEWRELGVKSQIRELVTLFAGPLCLRMERDPPSYVMQSTKVKWLARGGTERALG